MLTRRVLLTSAAALIAAPALAQGKKGAGGGESMSRLIGIDGSYTAYGRNPDGSEYNGRCEITQQGDAVEFTWHVAAQPNRGQGVIEGRVVTVDWGDTTPVVYVVMPDGELHGTWADGRAFEKLTRR
ncbi:MAG: hypothetical protein LJE68_11680 [Rhodobacter sp.]|jgi:hypothetical protein|nr:hypothetical protein [Rhodobacter sp.]